MLTGTWKEPSYTETVDNVLVIGLAENQGNRRIFEDSMSSAFKKAGKQATPSSKYFEDIREISKESVTPVVKDNKFDAVIVVRLLAISKEQRYVPSAYPAHYNNFYGYYGHVGVSHYNDPSYYVEETKVSLEINLYETANAKLIWAISTDTFSPDNVNKEINKLVDVIMENLKKDGLI